MFFHHSMKRITILNIKDLKYFAINTHIDFSIRKGAVNIHHKKLNHSHLN